ncbi:MAG: DUF5017 domain-containing protein [Crocinitomix sp.]|nr:DUF5017 domain-containing protein [Crocinitomix sp.]
MRKRINAILLGIFAISAVTACKKEPDSPPVNVITASDVITIDSLKAWQRSVNDAILITDTISVYGIVTMDEGNGNIYKNIYFQDHTGAINVRFTGGTDLVQGDSIRIALNGVTLNNFNGVYQLDGVEEETNVVVQSSGNETTPLTVSIDQIQSEYNAFLAEDSIVEFKYQSMLVRFTNVQFKTSELFSTYADAVTQSSENRLFEDFDGYTSFIRTSGFALFAADSLPKGAGTMICIVSEYNEEIQYILRSPEEADMNGPRGPGELLVKDFSDDDVTSGGWSVQQVIGADTWETAELGGWEDRPYAIISNFDDGNSACESWLVSPSLDLSGSTDASLSFDNAYNYSGDPLELLISTDYSGTGDPNLATWTPLSAIWSTGSFDFVNSGSIDLAAYLTNNVRIAFKYTGTDSSGRTWEIDNITING